MRLLRRLACTQVMTFDQCVYKCVARKPTTLLLLVRLPTMVRNTMHVLRLLRALQSGMA